MRQHYTEQFAGRNCWITCTDDSGRKRRKVIRVEDLTYVPVYGAYIIGDSPQAVSEGMTHSLHLE